MLCDGGRIEGLGFNPNNVLSWEDSAGHTAWLLFMALPGGPLILGNVITPDQSAPNSEALILGSTGHSLALPSRGAKGKPWFQLFAEVGVVGPVLAIREDVVWFGQAYSGCLVNSCVGTRSRKDVSCSVD